MVCDVADHKDSTVVPDRPIKITHVNLNSAKADTAYRFYIDALGFKLSDKSDMFYFMRCNSDHHSILIAKMSAPTLNHISFEMMDIDSVMRGAGRLNDHGYPIEWGPGRHGAGSNMFCYFAGPEELPIEYTTDVEQVDDSYTFHGPGLLEMAAEPHRPLGRDTAALAQAQARPGTVHLHRRSPHRELDQLVRAHVAAHAPAPAARGKYGQQSGRGFRASAGRQRAGWSASASANS